jgi:hypothetical protein
MLKLGFIGPRIIVWGNQALAQRYNIAVVKSVIKAQHSVGKECLPIPSKRVRNFVRASPMILSPGAMEALRAASHFL